MKKLSKKFLSLLMAAAMVVTIIPMGMITAEAASAGVVTNNDLLVEAFATPNGWTDSAHSGDGYGISWKYGWTDYDATTGMNIFSGDDAFTFNTATAAQLNNISSSTGMTVAFRFKSDMTQHRHIVSLGANAWDNQNSSDKSFYISGGPSWMGANGTAADGNGKYNALFIGYVDSGEKLNCYPDFRFSPNTAYDVVISISSTKIDYYIDGVHYNTLHYGDTYNSTNLSAALNAIKTYRNNYFGISRWNDGCIKAGVKDFRIYGSYLADINALYDFSVNRYETMMNKHIVYVNMLPAYHSYVDYCEAVDAEEYGNGSNLTTGVFPRFIKNTENMYEWTSYQGSFATSAADGSYTTSTLVNGDAMNNVLYAYGVGSTASYSFTYEKDHPVGIQYGSTVFVYDGRPMSFPVSLIEYKTKKSNKNPKAFYPSTDNFSLKKNWYGRTDSGAGYCTTSVSDGIGYSWDNTNTGSSISDNKLNHNYYYSNCLYYTGTPSNTYYSSIASVNWDVRHNSDQWGQCTQSVPIYFVNFSYYIGLVKAAVDMNFSVTDYREGGLLGRLTAINNAITYNAKTRFSDSTSINISTQLGLVQSDMESCISSLNASLVPDSYSAVKTALTYSGTPTGFAGTSLSGNTYSMTDILNSGGYLADTNDDGVVNSSDRQITGFSAFQASYNNAKGIMANLGTSGYNTNLVSNYTENATQYASNLMRDFNALSLIEVNNPTVSGSLIIGPTDSLTVTDTNSGRASYNWEYSTDSGANWINGGTITIASSGGSATFNPFSNNTLHSNGTALVRVVATISGVIEYDNGAGVTYTLYNAPTSNFADGSAIALNANVALTKSTSGANGTIKYSFDNFAHEATYSSAIAPFNSSADLIANDGVDNTSATTLTLYIKEEKSGCTSEIASYTYYLQTNGPAVAPANGAYLDADDTIIITNGDSGASTKYSTNSGSSWSDYSTPIVPFSGKDNTDGAATYTIRARSVRHGVNGDTSDYTYNFLCTPTTDLSADKQLLQTDTVSITDVSGANSSGATFQYNLSRDNTNWNGWTDCGSSFAPFNLSGYTNDVILYVKVRQKVSDSTISPESNSVRILKKLASPLAVKWTSDSGSESSTDEYAANGSFSIDTNSYSGKTIYFRAELDGVDNGTYYPYTINSGIDSDGDATYPNFAASSVVKLTFYVINDASKVKFAQGTFYNKQHDNLVYQESFNGSVSDTVYTPAAGSKGLRLDLGRTNVNYSYGMSRVDKAGDTSGFSQKVSETGTTADYRENVLKVTGNHSKQYGADSYVLFNSNPLSDSVTKAFAEKNGVTISFWRSLHATDSNAKKDVPRDDFFRRNGIAFRKGGTNLYDEIYGYFMIDFSGNLSFTKDTKDNAIDIQPAEYDQTEFTASKYSGYWQHIAVTVDPNAATLEEAITVYINGVQHNYPEYSSYIKTAKGTYSGAPVSAVGDIIDFLTSSSTTISLAHDNKWQDFSDDLYFDDVRLYSKALTQKEIWETYYDEYADVTTLEGNKPSVTHDPTTISVYTLKSASNGMPAGSLVGQEFIDYHNVPASNYTVEYYSYGTGLQIYHSTDSVNWEIVGDSKGRVAYQNHDQFVKDNGDGTFTPMYFRDALDEVCDSIYSVSNKKSYAGNLIWAPHVSYNLTTNKWMMYVSISYWGDCKSAIVALESVDGTPLHFKARTTSNTQAYNVIVKSTDRPNAIDPCTYYKYNSDGTIDPSTLYMAYGAWSKDNNLDKDLYTVQLNAQGTYMSSYSGAVPVTYANASSGGSTGHIHICSSQPTDPSGTGGHTGEGSYIVYHNGYYYLYVAYGINQYNYVTRVFRATSPTGPFVDYNNVNATSTTAIHGTQIMAPHYVTGDNYIYMSTGHDSIYKVVNNNGEVITIHSAHARPVSNNANGYKALPDVAMVTRQKDQCGNITITHPMFYTQSGWSISMPEQYDGTDTSSGIVSTQLDGLYKASTLHDIIDEDLSYSEKVYSNSTYSNNWNFSKYVYFLSSDATSGEIYGTGDGFLPLDLKYELSYDTGDAATSTTTYITIKNGSGVTVAEGVVAMHNGTPELSYFNIEQGDFGGGVDTRASSTVWSVKVDDLDAYADLNALDSAYAEGDALLKSLDGKTAQYNAASVQNLMDRLAEAKADVAVSTAKKKLVPASSQSSINTKADNITAAIAGLTPATSTVSEENFSTYEAAVSAINNIDPDAYEEIKDEAAPSGHIASAISTANTLVSGSSKTYENDYTIKVIDGTADQERVDLAVDTILDALNYCTKKYAVSADAGVTSIGSKNGTYKDGYATYGTSMTFRAASEDTAWNLEVTSNTSHKKPAFYGYGQSITVKVTGALDVTTETRSGSEKKVRILRHYDNSTNERVPVQFAEFVSAGSYTLPSAANTPAIAFYSFDGYYIGETKYAAGATVTISEDTDIIAKYKYNASASNAITATALSGGTSISGTYAYNAKLELKGGENAYGWSVDLGNGKYRPFYVGADLTYYAMDSLNLVAEDETTFKAHGYSLPAVYLRNGGAIDVSGSKITFNAQVVSDNMDSIQECGILVAVPNGKQPGSSETVTPVTPEDFQVIVENSGQQMGYAILRAKSTKFVGANQIAIAVNNLPEGYVYRAYAIYNHGGALETVYTDVVR